MMEQHFVPAVFDRDIVIELAVGVDAHARQRVMERLEKILHKAVVALEALVDRVQILFLAERKLHVVVRAVVGKYIAAFAVDSGIDVPFLIKAGRDKIKCLQKRRSQLMHHGKIHRLVTEIDDRHFDLDADITLLFLFGRFYITCSFHFLTLLFLI